MSSALDGARERTTVLTLQQKKARGERISILAAYDFPTARLLDAAGIDAILVGDSLAMVVLGHETTLAATMDEMLHHARAVARGARRALLVGDMPFLSYQADPAEAVRNAGRFLKEGGMDAVKLEGGRDVEEAVRRIVRAGIPVMGHLGLQPQSVRRLGGFRVQGRTAAAALSLLDDARTLEDAGCFALVLESVPARVAEAITARVRIPTIGIGAGAGTDGQVLVLHDLVGLTDQPPRFAPRYADLGSAIGRAAAAFRRDVETGGFPGPEHSFTMPDDEWAAFSAALVPVGNRPR
ncbi:MAG TPA: 3-methyl-2-oxobutanoate hydroxymethyltransferase [Vicinamibacteria bacterium]|nr:3-methyl-2-oxobutanoate hydroxymethyltransferase [Vicinamibacteria bacterium]